VIFSKIVKKRILAAYKYTILDMGSNPARFLLRDSTPISVPHYKSARVFNRLTRFGIYRIIFAVKLEYQKIAQVRGIAFLSPFLLR